MVLNCLSSYQDGLLATKDQRTFIKLMFRQEEKIEFEYTKTRRWQIYWARLKVFLSDLSYHFDKIMGIESPDVILALAKADKK